MTGLSETETNLPSPFASRAVQSQTVSLEEAERDAVQVYYGSLTKQALVSVLVTIFFLFIMGYTAVSDRKAETKYKLGGAAVLTVCAAGLAFAIYEYRRKQRVFILND